MDVSADPFMRPRPRTSPKRPAPSAANEARHRGWHTVVTGVNGSRACCRQPRSRPPPVRAAGALGHQQPAGASLRWWYLPCHPLSGRPAARGSPLRTLRSRSRSPCMGERQGRAFSGSFATSAPHRPWRNLRAPLAAYRAMPTQCGWSPLDDRPQPATLDADYRFRSSAAADPGQDASARLTRGCLDWLVGMAFPFQLPFCHHYSSSGPEVGGSCPDSFLGAGSHSPSLTTSARPLGINRTPAAAHDRCPPFERRLGFRDWGRSHLTRTTRNAQPARLDLGSPTLAGLWSPAAVRPLGPSPTIEPRASHSHARLIAVIAGIAVWFSAAGAAAAPVKANHGHHRGPQTPGCDG